MSDPMNSSYVNWVDGMKMSKAHFLQLQQAVEDRLKDIRTIHDPFTDHGLLGVGPGGEPSLDLSVTIEGRSRYQVELRQCRAVTPAGDRIELLSSMPPLRLTGEVPARMLIEGSAFDLILRTSTTITETVGVPDPSESPARHPGVRPELTLELAPVKELQQGAYARHHIAIARLHVVKEEVEQDPGHIPPALAMSGHPRLLEFIREYAKFLKDTERDLLRIRIKLTTLKDAPDLQLCVDQLCRSGLRFLETGMAQVQFMGPNMRPREVMMHAAQFARTLYHAIELLTGRGKDALLDYVREHTGVQPAEHIATLTGLMDLGHDHGDLQLVLGRVSLFCRTHKKLFDKWVDLDYIGQKRDKDIFIAQDTPTERPVAPKPPPEAGPKPVKPPSGWDF